MRVIVLLLYAPICLVALRLLLPRLSPASRLLAIATLSAQIVILVVALEDTPRWELKGWLWHLDQEWSIPSTFASAQLALVCATALAAALLARGRHTLYRLNLILIGMLFLVFAWDEYFYLHEGNMPLIIAYVIVSAVIVMASTKMALRSPPRARLSQISLMAGMALYFFGAVVLEPFHETCVDLGFIRIEGCLRIYNLEEACELLGVWLILVAVLGCITELAPRPRRLVSLLLYAWLVLWILLLTRDAWLPRFELQFRAKPALVAFESDLRLLGYHVKWDEESLDLWLYPSAWRSHYNGLGFSVHLIDQASGKSIASYDRHTRSQKRLLHGTQLRPRLSQTDGT